MPQIHAQHGAVANTCSLTCPSYSPHDDRCGYICAPEIHVRVKLITRKRNHSRYIILKIMRIYTRIYYNNHASSAGAAPVIPSLMGAAKVAREPHMPDLFPSSFSLSLETPRHPLRAESARERDKTAQGNCCCCPVCEQLKTLMPACTTTTMMHTRGERVVRARRIYMYTQVFGMQMLVKQKGFSLSLSILRTLCALISFPSRRLYILAVFLNRSLYLLGGTCVCKTSNKTQSLH